MADPRFVITTEAEPFADELDKLIDAAREAGIATADIAVALEDRAGREARRAEQEDQTGR